MSATFRLCYIPLFITALLMSSAAVGAVFVVSEPVDGGYTVVFPECKACALYCEYVSASLSFERGNSSFNIYRYDYTRGWVLLVSNVSVAKVRVKVDPEIKGNITLVHKFRLIVRDVNTLAPMFSLESGPVESVGGEEVVYEFPAIDLSDIVNGSDSVRMLMFEVRHDGYKGDDVVLSAITNTIVVVERGFGCAPSRAPGLAAPGGFSLLSTAERFHAELLVALLAAALVCLLYKAVSGKHRIATVMCIVIIVVSVAAALASLELAYLKTKGSVRSEETYTVKFSDGSTANITLVLEASFHGNIYDDVFGTGTAPAFNVYSGPETIALETERLTIKALVKVEGNVKSVIVSEGGIYTKVLEPVGVTCPGNLTYEKKVLHIPRTTVKGKALITLRDLPIQDCVTGFSLPALEPPMITHIPPTAYTTLKLKLHMTVIGKEVKSLKPTCTLQLRTQLVKHPHPIAYTTKTTIYTSIATATTATALLIRQTTREH